MYIAVTVFLCCNEYEQQSEMHDSYLRVSTDIDECVGDSPCDVNAVCHNTESSYTCQCGEGYSGTGMQCEGIVSVDKTIPVSSHTLHHLLGTTFESTHNTHLHAYIMCTCKETPH